MRIPFTASALLLGATFFATSALATPPQVDTTKNNKTIYPIEAQGAGEQGVVGLRVYVHTNGRTVRVKVTRSSGYADLDTAAIQTVMNWHYIPAMEGGEATSEWMALQINYQLPNKAAPTN
jgi:periplasmic protein TonB